MIQEGCILIARQIIESDIWQDKPAMWLKIWIYILLEVNHKDNKRFKRGSGFMQYKRIIANTGATKDQIKHTIAYLKEASMLATRKATRGMIVFVLTYDKYQSLENYKSHTKSLLKATATPHRSHTINKNVNNVKNVKNDILQPTVADPVNQIIDLFYDGVNPQINYENKTTRKATNDLLENYSLEELTQITKYAISIQGQQYAPVITTPYELKEKMAKLKIYWEREKENNKPRIAFIS